MHIKKCGSASELFIEELKRLSVAQTLPPEEEQLSDKRKEDGLENVATPSIDGQLQHLRKDKNSCLV